MKTVLIPVLLALMTSGCASVGSPVQRQCYHENELAEKDIGYCRAIRVGHTLYVSGTAGQGDMPTAIRSVYRRLQQTLEANGLTYADVVREVVYATDLDALIQHKDLRKDYYGQNLPASTWVQVQRLYAPSLVLEVEITAVDRTSAR